MKLTRWAHSHWWGHCEMNEIKCEKWYIRLSTRSEWRDIWCYFFCLIGEDRLTPRLQLRTTIATNGPFLVWSLCRYELECRLSDTIWWKSPGFMIYPCNPKRYLYSPFGSDLDRNSAFISSDCQSNGIFKRFVLRDEARRYAELLMNFRVSNMRWSLSSPCDELAGCDKYCYDAHWWLWNECGVIWFVLSTGKIPMWRLSIWQVWANASNVVTSTEHFYWEKICIRILLYIVILSSLQWICFERTNGWFF